MVEGKVESLFFSKIVNGRSRGLNFQHSSSNTPSILGEDKQLRAISDSLLISLTMASVFSALVFMNSSKAQMKKTLNAVDCNLTRHNRDMRYEFVKERRVVSRWRWDKNTSVSISGLTKTQDIVKDTKEAVLLQKIEVVRSQIEGLTLIFLIFSHQFTKLLSRLNK